MALPKNDNGWNEFKKLVLFRLDDLSTDHKTLSAKVDGFKGSFNDKLETVKTEIIEKVNQLELKYTRIDTKLKFTMGMYTAIGSAFFGIIINIIMQVIQE